MFLTTARQAWGNVSIFLCLGFFSFSSELVSTNTVRVLFPWALELAASPSKGFRTHQQHLQKADVSLVLVSLKMNFSWWTEHVSRFSCFKENAFFPLKMTPIQKYFSCFPLLAKGTTEAKMTLKFTLLCRAGQQWRKLVSCNPWHFSLWLNEGNIFRWSPV